MENLNYLSTPKGISDRGTDFLFKEKKVISVFEKWANLIGCSSIKLAPVGFTETYKYVGNTTGEKTYEFKDRASRNLILNPDSTPSVLRFFVDNSNFEINRYFFYNPTFRYRNRKHRYYHQIGYSMINCAENYNNLDENSMLILISYLNALNELKIKINIKLSHFGLIRAIMCEMGIINEKTESDLLLNCLRPLNYDERKLYITNHFPFSYNRDLLVYLLTNDKINLFDIPTNFIQGVEITNFYSILCEQFKYPVFLSFSDLRSSELQNGIVYKIFNGDKKIGDGGCYSYIANQFHSKIFSMKSIAVVLEDIIDLISLEKHNNDKAILLLIDCEYSYALKAYNYIKIERNYSTIVIQRTDKPKKLIEKMKKRGIGVYLVGKTEQDTSTIKYLDIKNTKKINIKSE